MTRITLSVDEAIAEKAKQLAKANNTSVSSMFSRFVESMAAAQASPAEIGPITRELTGVIELPPDKDYKELLTEALMDKYGLDK